MKGKVKSKSVILIISVAVFILGITSFYAFNSQEFSKTDLSDAEQIISKCEDDVLCAVDSIQVLAKNGKDEKIIDTFHELVSLYEKNYPCHMVAHHLGMWLYGYVGEIDEALKNAKMICGGAIYHGVLQKYLMTEHFVNTDPSEIVFDKICPENENHPYAIERCKCLHGLGHGLNVFYDNDVFEAIKICEQFDPGWEQISCSKGVFMQNVVYNLDTGGGTFDKNDRFYPCNKVDSKWAPQCYHYHTTYLLLKNKFSVTKSYDDCDRITPEEFVKYCYHGMGRQLEQNIRGQIDKAIEFCIEGKQSIYHTDCFRGMVMTIVNGNTDPQIGFQYCSLIPEEFKVDCYDALGRWVHMLQSTDEGRSTECVRAENSDYFDICMNASLESLKLL